MYIVDSTDDDDDDDNDDDDDFTIEKLLAYFNSSCQFYF